MPSVLQLPLGLKSALPLRSHCICAAYEDAEASQPQSAGQSSGEVAGAGMRQGGSTPSGGAQVGRGGMHACAAALPSCSLAVAGWDLLLFAVLAGAGGSMAAVGFCWAYVVLTCTVV